MATTGAELVFVDTNVLVHANDADSPFHQDARARLLEIQTAGCEIWINRQVLREYAVVVSRKMNEKNAFDASTLNADLERFEAEFWVADETSAVTEKLRILVETYQVKGKPIHDANIVATMQANSIGKLLTGNVQDFKRFVPLIEVIPLVH